MNIIPEMTEKERKIISDFIEEKMGIKMPPVKKQLLQSRLSKRLNSLKMKTFREYINYLKSSDGIRDELYKFINIITTNKTDFFREEGHFSYVSETILPEILKHEKRSVDMIRIWSAGCSTGEEPYSIAMAIENFKLSHNRSDIDYKIMGSDVSTDVLDTALRAVYESHKINTVSMFIKKQFFLKNKDDDLALVRVRPFIREKVFFRRINLIDDDYKISDRFDIIFCRNLLIYFDKDKQEMIVKKIIHYLKSGGYLLIGHSESLFGFDVDLKCVKPTIYRKY